MKKMKEYLFVWCGLKEFQFSHVNVFRMKSNRILFWEEYERGKSSSKLSWWERGKNPRNYTPHAMDYEISLRQDK